MLLGVTALLLILLCILPGLTGRITWEQGTKVYVTAIDTASLEDRFDADLLPGVLRDYRDAGTTTALFWEGASGYNEPLMAQAAELGLSIALSPDVALADTTGLQRLVQEYPVRYLCLRLSAVDPEESLQEKADLICGVLRKSDLTLVLTENLNQIGNAEPPGYETYLDAARGSILRAFMTYPRSSLIHGDYPVLYYQMYNSLTDRNTQFLQVLQPEDEGYTAQECARRAQLSIELFSRKAEQKGYIPEGRVDHSTYAVSPRPVCAGAAALAVLMLVTMLSLAPIRTPDWLLSGGLLAAAAALGITFVLPEALLSLYPTAFCLIAPSFSMTVCLAHLEGSRQKPLPVLMLSTLALTLACMAVTGAVTAALLSGTDYFLNNQLFRGVKLTLLAPVAYACLVIGLRFLRTISGIPVKTLLHDLRGRLRWYHGALAAALGAAAVVYLIRSGNVISISFGELYMRNLLSDIFTARPRTKEFLVGWPCLVMLICCIKADRMKLLQAVFALGAAILFASCMNTFCHAFTMVHIMYLRLFYGFLLGAAISVIAVGALQLLFRIADRKT